MKAPNLKGQRFGRLLVLEDSGERKDRKVVWVCLCDCGNIKDVRSGDLKRGHTKSCGCLRDEVTRKRSYKHGDACRNSVTRLNQTWRGMKARCYNPNANEYKRYGGRGITVCDEWKNDYLPFKLWAMASGYKSNLTIDRKDNDGNYEPNNCQFITKSENATKGNLCRWANQ